MWHLCGCKSGSWKPVRSLLQPVRCTAVHTASGAVLATTQLPSLSRTHAQTNTHSQTHTHTDTHTHTPTHTQTYTHTHTHWHTHTLLQSSQVGGHFQLQSSSMLQQHAHWTSPSNSPTPYPTPTTTPPPTHPSKNNNWKTQLVNDVLQVLLLLVMI